MKEKINCKVLIKRSVLLMTFVFLTFMSQAQKAVSNNLEDYYLDLWGKNLDSLCKQSEKVYDYKNYEEKSSIPKIDSKKIEAYIKEINADLPLRYDFRVQEILLFYLQNSSKTALALAYFKSINKDFEEMLDMEGLPKTLKYLPFALSSMNNSAIGKTGSSGLWQLMYSTARREGLRIDSYVDERRNVEKATTAAINELKKLYSLYNDWELSLGAYTCGPSNINKNIRRNNNQLDYYQLYHALPVFGRDIVPAITAACILDNYYSEFNVKIPEINFQIESDTVEVSQRLHFKQLNAVLGISLDTLRFLNPDFKHDIVPAMHELYNVYLPKGNLSVFNKYEDSIYHFNDSVLFELKKSVILPPPAKSRYYAKYEPQKVPDGSALVYYHIKSGDNLGYVAEWYNVKVREIEDWNNVYDPRRIQIGKKLKIYVPEEKEAYYKEVDKLSFEQKQKRVGKSTSTVTKTVKKEKPLGKDWFYHTVKSGESPYQIAKKYKGVSPEDIMRWNNISNPRNIRVGQKLKIKKL